jgi:hypothetical protein
MYQRWYPRKLKEVNMPLPGSKREKQMLAEMEPKPAPRTRTRVKPAFLQEVVEPEVQVEENAEDDSEEE